MSEIIESGLDQGIPLVDTIEFRSSIQLVDEAVRRAIETRNPSEALPAAMSLCRNLRASGLALAKWLYEMGDRWYAFGMGEVFEDWVYKRLGISSQTTAKYVRIWRKLYSSESKVPEPYRRQLLAKSMAAQEKVASLVDEPLDEDTWDRIVQAPDNKTVIAIVQDVRDKPANPNRLTIYLRRDGTLEAWLGNGSECSILGILRTSEEDLEDPLRRRAIEFLVRSSRIQGE